MAFRVGKPTSLDDITVRDVEAHPIWSWVGTAEPQIAVRAGSGLMGSASYDPEMDALKAIALWQNDSWVGLERSGVSVPITFTAIPTIRGVSRVEFVCEAVSPDIAVRVG